MRFKKLIMLAFLAAPASFCVLASLGMGLFAEKVSPKYPTAWMGPNTKPS